MPTGMIRAPGILWMPERSNHLPIPSKSSSLELSWPVDMQRHGYRPMRHRGHVHGHDKGPQNLADAGMQQPLGGFISNQDFRTVLACRCATLLSIAPEGITGMPVGMIRAPWIMWTLELRNHWPNSLQIKFFGTVLVCRCATSWPFAHRGLMGTKCTLGILFTGRRMLQGSACLFIFIFLLIWNRKRVRKYSSYHSNNILR